MEKSFSGFTKQIPNKNMQNDEKYFGHNIAIFKPKEYITDKIVKSDDYHMFILSSAPPDIYVNGRKQLLQQGCIFCLNPEDSILCENAPITKPYTSILIKPKIIDKMANELDMEGIKFFKFQNPLFKDIIYSIETLTKEIEDPNSSSLMIDCLETQITILLLRNFKTNIRNDFLLLPNADTYINLAMEYIQMYYSGNLTIEGICDEIHVSTFHFIRTFKKKTGQSPYQYLISVRIQKAKELLHNGGYSVSEVCELCGFTSLSHFSNTFKMITGDSPSRYKSKVY